MLRQKKKDEIALQTSKKEKYKFCIQTDFTTIAHVIRANFIY
jgi:hypothetical protein